MRKIISLMLAVIVIAALCACGNTTDNKPQQINPNTSSNSSDNKQETGNNNEVPTKTEPSSAQEYQLPTAFIDDDNKFAYICESPYEGYEHIYWYVLETGPAGTVPNMYNGVIMTQKSTGVNMTEGYYYDTGYRTEWYYGSVCLDEHIKERDEQSLFREYWHDKMLLTIAVYSKEEIDPTDVELTFTGSVYGEHYGTKAIDPVVLQLNATKDDITLNQKYIHNSTIFELDGYYYLLNASSSGGGGGSTVKYNTLSIKFLSGTKETLKNSLDGKWKMLYDIYYYDDGLYLKEKEDPDGYQKYLECTDDICFGYELIDESQEFDSELNFNLYKLLFCYTDSEGNEHIIAK